MAVTIRKNDVRASNLMLLSLALSVVSFFLFRPPFKPTHLSQRTYDLVILATFLLLMGLSWTVRAGKRWAKVTLLLLCIPGTISYLMRLPEFLSDFSLRTALGFLITILQIGSIVIIARDLLRRPVAENTAL